MNKTIGLIDVDGHNFPNLALMRISAWHKAKGDLVEWYQPPMFQPWYGIVYASKVFSDVYSKDYDWRSVTNAGEIRKGGTGYCISLGADGKEHFDESKNYSLPPEVERMFPDYSIYPQYDFANGSFYMEGTTFPFRYGRKFTIVGNRWDNPELLLEVSDNG